MTTPTYTYSLDQELSQRYRAPVISLNLAKALGPEQLLAMALPTEKALMNSLIEQELTARRRESKTGRVDTHTPFSFFRVRPSLSYELLQKLSCTQRLFYNKQPLLCDFFSRLALEYIIEPTGDSHVAISAFLSGPSTSYKLSECALILQGAPHMIVKDRFLRFIDPEVSWQEINGFEKEKILTKSDYARWLKELQSQDHCPKIHELQGTEPAKVDPLPVLMLSDATCAFANLYMQLGAKRSPYNEIAPTPTEKSFESDLLEAGFCKKPTASTRYYCPTDKAIAAVQFLLELGWTVYDHKANALFPLHSVEARIEEETLRGSVLFGNETIDLSLFAAAVNKNEKTLSLGFQKSGLLCLDKHAALIPLFKEIEFVSGTAKIPKEALNLVSELVDTGAIEVSNREELLRIRAVGKPELLPLEEPGSVFKGSLRAYQQIGVNWMKHLFKTGSGGLLADEMGLGKTVQVIAFLSTHTSFPKTLVVAPTTLLHNWKQELATFLPSSRSLVFHGAKRDEAALTHGYDIIITSYGTLRADLPLFQKEPFDCLIVDEAQAIKNRETKNFQALDTIEARFRLSLTGTPVENALSELHSHFHFLNPGLLKENYSLPQIRQKITPFFLKRKKSDVAKQLPEKIEQTIVVPMTESQKAIYTQFQQSLAQGLLKKVSLDGAKQHRMEILEAILRLRQICCHPALVPQITGEKEHSSGKYSLVCDDIETLITEGKKVLLFSQFSSMLHLLAKEAKDRKWNALLLDGQTKNRGELVDRFQNDPDVPLFLMSLKAGGVGLNLTRADYVLLYDPWWNRAQEMQAIDRAHRIGREETVFCRRYVMEETIEEKILELQEKKSVLIDALFEEEESASPLSADDLFELLQ